MVPKVGFLPLPYISVLIIINDRPALLVFKVKLKDESSSKIKQN